MAYQLKEQKLLPNGLNLLAPSDQVTEGDCIDLGDWWSGAAGRLEQAPTEVQVNSGSVYTAQDSICQVTGSSSRIYYGGGGYLRQIGRAADAPIVAGLDGAPLGMLSYQGYVWIMNRQVTVTTPYLGKGQCKDDGTTVTDWSPAAPGVPTLQDGGVNGAALSPAVHNPPEVGGLLAQQYSYFVTWQLGTLGESNPSTVSGVITPATITPAVDGSIVRITQPTPPANATGWNIYRKSLLVGTVYRLNEFTLDITRTYVDDYGDDVHTHSDNQLLSLGIIMEGDHDPAPPCRVIANQTYNGRILVANSASHPNRLWYTPALQPAFFRGAANPNAGDWVDIGTDAGDEILVMTVRPGIVIIYRSHSIWRHVGDLGDPNARIECVVPDLGTVGVRGAVATSLGDYFIWNDGVYRSSNDWAQKVSQKVEPVFRGLSTENLVTLGTSYRSKCAIGYKNGRVWVSYPPTSGALGGASLVYHVDSQRWFNCSAAFLAFFDTGTAFLGAGPGVFSLESSYAGASALTFQSEYQDCGLPDHEKTWGDLVINHNTQGQTLTILIRTNKKATSNDSFTLATISSSALTKQVIPLIYPSTYAVTALRGKPIRAYNLSVRITGSGTGATTPPIIIDTPILLHYYVEARQGKTFDTGITSHGLEGVGTIDEVELDVDTSAGTATLVISSDIPGGVMADRTSGGITVVQTTGRQVLRLVLATPIDGRRFRHQMSTTTALQVYGYRVRLLPIGVYLDGVQSEVWQTGSLVTGV